MIIRKATFADIDALIKLRLIYLTHEFGLTPDEEGVIKAQLVPYFTKHLGDDFIAVLAETANKTDGTAMAVSTAFLVITEKPANPSFLTGKTGTLLNVLTLPEYRRLGIATKVIGQIIEMAKQLSVSSIDLSASPDGKPLYNILGFKEPDPQSKFTPMKLRLV